MYPKLSVKFKCKYILKYFFGTLLVYT